MVRAANQHAGDDEENQTSKEFLKLLKLDHTELDDETTLAQANLKDQAELFVVLQIADNEWEAVEVVPTTESTAATSTVTKA